MCLQLPQLSLPVLLTDGRRPAGRLVNGLEDRRQRLGGVIYGLAKSCTPSSTAVLATALR